jgi:pentapeptide MXKDX repeat protein
MQKRILIVLFTLGLLAGLATTPGQAQDKMPDDKTSGDKMAGDKMSKKKPKKSKKDKMDKMEKKEDGKM